MKISVESKRKIKWQELLRKEELTKQEATLCSGITPGMVCVVLVPRSLRDKLRKKLKKDYIFLALALVW